MAKTTTNSDLNFGQKVCYWLLLGVIKLIGLLPYVVLYYMLAPLIYFILYRVVRYRLKVVRKNLANAFPEKTEDERLEIEMRFYKHLSEVFVDVIDLTSMSRKELQRRMVVENMEEFDREVGTRDWVAALAHYGEWEFFSMFAITHPYHNLGVYHPLKNKVMDRFMIHLRTRFGMEVVPMFGLARRVLQCRKQGEQMALGLIADQGTSERNSDRKWRTFLNQPTLFFGGMGHYARRFGMPVYFLETTERKPSHYVCRFVQLYDGVEPISEEEVMDRYVAKLEEMIRRRPELWLWSHNRWKLKPTAPQQTETAADGEVNQ